MNLEVAAVGRLRRATVWLSRESTQGVLPVSGALGGRTASFEL
jgi:hypothetical protein